ncbi:MAG: hypothetical protein R6V04_10620 [bacterium]
MKQGMNQEISEQDISISTISNQQKDWKKQLKTFVDFHWQHYENDPQYIPLLDYEYLGFKLIGIKGFFEPDNLFFKHAEMIFFLARYNDQIIGRCNAFVNFNHNKKWNDKVGFFGQFETIDNAAVAKKLINASENWLKKKGMKIIRGPQNLPVNEATPGLMVSGFQSRPVMYYHYNKPYYETLLKNCGFQPVQNVLSWEVAPQRPMEEKLTRVSNKVLKRYNVTIEGWGDRTLDVRKKEMREIYNDAWSDNFGFVPFTEEEFNRIVDDMLLIMDKDLFIFLYVKGEPAGFFGGVPNVTEKMKPISWCRRCELLRALKMILLKNRTKGFRLGYLGVKKKFRRLGLDGVMLCKQKKYSQEKGYTYCDMGWVLEDNYAVKRVINFMEAIPSKKYTVFEKKID